MPQHLLEHHTSVQCDLFLLVAFEGCEEDVGLFGEVFDSRPPRTDLSSKEVIEYLYDIFARLEFESMQVQKEMVEQIGIVCFLGQLGHHFW